MTVRIHDEVETALAEGRPVVALETAVVTAGLPREPLPASIVEGLAGWDGTAPAHHEAARLMSRAVREGGAVPAIVAVMGGELRIGLDEAALDRLAGDRQAAKASVATLGGLIAAGSTAGTTVSATLAACGLARPRPLRVLATGGIGGVHLGWTDRPDVSADLGELARSRVCVVCAGAKSVLDIEATIEVLETLGIPVVGYGTDRFPAFYSRSGPEARRVPRVDGPDDVARLCRTHWETLDRHTALLVARPVDERWALPETEVCGLAEAAAEDAAASVRDRDVTPFLLDALARRTGGRTVRANLELLRANAALAASVAGALT